MKRIIVITVCCLLLSGCSIFPERETRPPARPTSPVTIDYVPDHTFYNYDAYLEFWAHEEKPINFVHYEQIASLGEFQMYESVHGINPDGSAQYTYTLKDEKGRIFYISVFKTAMINEYKEANFVDTKDLRSIVGGYEESYREFSSNGMEYVYRGKTGRLVSIDWVVEGFGVSLRVEKAELFSPNPEGTFVERLLCLESAPAAVEEFEQMISIPYEPDTNTSH